MHVDLVVVAAEQQLNPQGASDYAELKRQILALGLLNRQPGYYLAKFASTATFQTPEQFIETIKSDLKRWGPVVKASGFVAVD